MLRYFKQVACVKSKEYDRHNGVRYFLRFIVLAFGLQCCSAPKYIVKEQSGISEPDLESSTVNYIPIPDDELRKSVTLDSSVHLIGNKKYSKLDKYIHAKEVGGVVASDIFLSKALLLITRKEYPEAFQSLAKIDDSDYPMLRKLLTLDLNYEIARTHGSFDYKNLLKDYQSFIDAYPDDLLLKKIVSIRLRYLRYNY